MPLYGPNDELPDEVAQAGDEPVPPEDVDPDPDDAGDPDEEDEDGPT